MTSCHEFVGRLMGVQVLSLQPQLIADPVPWRVFVFDPRLLRFDHEFLGVTLCLLELFQPLGHLRYGRLLITPISVGIVAHYEKERGLPCSLMYPIIVCKFCERE